MAARTKRITFGKATFLGMHIKVPSNWPRISQREWRLGVRIRNTAMAEIRGKRLGAALRKRAVTVLARALRKAPVLKPLRDVLVLRGLLVPQERLGWWLNGGKRVFLNRRSEGSNSNPHQLVSVSKSKATR